MKAKHSEKDSSFSNLIISQNRKRNKFWINYIKTLNMGDDMKPMLHLSTKKNHQDLILTHTKIPESNQSSNKTLSIGDMKIPSLGKGSGDIRSRDSYSQEKNNYNTATTTIPKVKQSNKFHKKVHSNSEQSPQNLLKTIDSTKTVKSNLPSLTTSLDSDRFLKVYSAIQSQMVHTNKNITKKESEDFLILKRLNKLNERNNTDTLPSPSLSQLNKEQGFSTMRKDYRRKSTRESEYNCTDSSNYPANMKTHHYLINKNDREKSNIMNIFQHVSPKASDPKVEINCKQHEMNIIPNKETPRTSEISISHVEMQNSSEDKNKNKNNLSTFPRKIVISQSLPKTIAGKLNSKDGNLNTQKKINNICITKDLNENKNENQVRERSIASGNKEKEKTLKTKAIESHSSFESEPNRLKETEAVSTDHIKKNDTTITIPTVIKESTVIATNEETEQIAGEKKEKVRSDKHQMTQEGEDNKTIDNLTERMNMKTDFILRSKFINAKHFLTQLSKISERSNLFSKENDSNSFEKSPNPNIRQIKLSNTSNNDNPIQIPIRKSRTNLGIEKICGNIDFIYKDTDLDKRAMLIRRAQTMHSSKNRDYLNHTAPHCSYASDNSFSKKNNTINEEAVYDSSQDNTDSPQRISKRYSNATDLFNQPNSLMSTTSILRYNRQRPRSVCISTDKYSFGNSGNVAWNKKLPKILLKLQHNIEEPFKKIEGSCSCSKLEFFDKSVNKIVLVIESELEENKRMKKKTKAFLIQKVPPLSELYFNRICDTKNVDDSDFFEIQFYHANLRFHQHERLQLSVSIDKLYRDMIFSRYFEINLSQKVHKEDYLADDLECQPGKNLTIFANFRIDQKSFTKYLHKHSVNIETNKEVHLNALPICFELGFDNSQFINRYLLLDNVNQDGSNKLSAMSTLNENEKCTIQLNLTFGLNSNSNDSKANIGHRKSLESISSEGGPVSPKEDLGIPEESYLLKRQRKMTMSMRENPSSEINKIKAALQSRRKFSFGRVNSIKVLEKGYLGTQQLLNQNLDRNNKAVSILRRGFYNRIRNEEINRNFLRMTKELEKLRLVMHKRRSTYFTSPLKSYRREQLNQDHEQGLETKVSQKTMNKESVMFRTLELKSKLLSKYESNKDILLFHIKDDNPDKFIEIIEKYKISTEEQDEEGNTFLNIAVQCNNYRITSYLLNVGAEVNTHNKKFNTPLHYSLAYKNYILTDLLIKRGADESIKNMYGLTPWQCLFHTESIM